MEFVRNKEETGSRVLLKNIDGRNWVRVARDDSACKSDALLARVGNEANRYFLKATPSLRASLAPPGTLTPPTALVSVDRKEVEAVQHPQQGDRAGVPPWR